MKRNSALKLVTQESRDIKVPLAKADLPKFDELKGPLQEILASGQLSNFGKYNSEFEQAASHFLGTNVATVSSGTMGLILSLQALDLKPGMKVLFPSFTFMATGQAVLYAGGIPKFAEIDRDMTLSTKDLKSQLNKDKDISIVIAVHSYGLPAKVDEIREIVESINESQHRNIRILYDAAHAFGSAIGDRRIGTFGDVEVFSLSATKALVSVEGGMICSHDLKFIERIRKMRNYGIEEKYDAHYPGLNGKMSEFHALIGLLNISRLEQVLAIRKEKASYYREQIESKTKCRTIPIPENVTHTHKDFTVFLPEKMAARRSEVSKFLSENGVDNRAYFFPPVHEQIYFRKYAERALPVTEDLSRKVLTIPFFTSITETQMDHVVRMLALAEEQFT